MKKLSIIFIMAILPAIVNGQMNAKSKLEKLDKDNLNLSLARSLKTIKTGKIMTGIGSGLLILGGVMMIQDKEQTKSLYDGNGRVKTTFTLDLPSNEEIVGGLLLIGGAITDLIGIPKWISGSRMGKNIEIEILKFNSVSSAAITGIGLKIRF